MSVPPTSAPSRQPWLGLSRRAWLIAALAFGIGLVLFLLLWAGDRGNDFYRAGPRQESAAGQQFEPLPAPLPAGEPDDNASGMQPPGQGEQTFPQIVEEALPPLPAPPPIAAPATPPAPSTATMAPGDMPIPLESPAPRYPPQALRRGESGTVLLRVHVGPDGVPYAVDLVQSSHSRLLDRAASEAVRRWRFLPAQRNGRPVSGIVEVPIAFDARR